MLTLTLLLSVHLFILNLDDVIAVAESGKHVLCEKPMARTVTECDQIIQVCQQNGIILMVAFMKRYNIMFPSSKT